MIFYYFNPRNHNIICFDTKAKEIYVLLKIENIRVHDGMDTMFGDGEEDSKHFVRNKIQLAKEDSTLDSLPEVEERHVEDIPNVQPKSNIPGERRNRYSDEEIKEMKKLKSEGVSMRKIAAKFGCSYQTVYLKTRE